MTDPVKCKRCRVTVVTEDMIIQEDGSTLCGWCVSVLQERAGGGVGTSPTDEEMLEAYEDKLLPAIVESVRVADPSIGSVPRAHRRALLARMYDLRQAVVKPAADLARALKAGREGGGSDE